MTKLGTQEVRLDHVHDVVNASGPRVTARHLEGRTALLSEEAAAKIAHLEVGDSFDARMDVTYDGWQIGKLVWLKWIHVLDLELVP